MTGSYFPSNPRKYSGPGNLPSLPAWLLFFYSGMCCGFELDAFQTSPGTRAMGMAGVFAAQADDSSAIWYNPAGLASAAAANTDISVEFANIPEVNERDEYARSGIELKFLGAYTQRRFAIFGDAHLVRIGAGYFLPYRPTLYIDAPRPAASSNPADPYGDIDVTHRQISALIAMAPRSSFAWGATADAMWSEIRCRDYKECVNKGGPVGYGASLGAKYTGAKFSWGDASIAAAWHSRIGLSYASHGDSGLGSVVEDYIPGRPESLALGGNVRVSTALALININAQTERIGWGDTSKKAAIANSKKLGVSAEALFPLPPGNTFALRMGTNRASAPGTSSVRILAAGIGYSFKQYHSVDFAWERRSSSSGALENFSSFSYSLQR